MRRSGAGPGDGLMHFGWATLLALLTFVTATAIATVVVVFIAATPASAQEEAIPLSMVAYGDSMGAGSSDFFGGGYNPRLEAYAETDLGRAVNLSNKSVGGYNTAAIYLTMQSSASSIQGADIITTDGGGNDWRMAREKYNQGSCGGTTCLNNMLAQFKSNWSAMMNTISANKKAGANVKVMSYFYPYVNEDKRSGKYNTLASYHKQMTDYAKSTAEAKGFQYLDLIPMFNGSYYFPQDPRTTGKTGGGDPLHPTAYGHTLIADGLRAQGYAPLQ